MGERIQVRKNVAAKIPLYVYNAAGAAVTGKVNSDFTKELLKDWVHDTTTVTISEIDSTHAPGWYLATLTPTEVKEYHLIVSSAFSGFALMNDWTLSVKNEDIDSLIQSLLVAEVDSTVEGDSRYNTHCLAFALAIMTNKVQIDDIANTLTVRNRANDADLGVFDLTLAQLQGIKVSVPQT